MNKLICPVFSAAEKNPDSIAILSGKKKIDYSTLNKMICNVMKRLRYLGVKEKNKVLIRSKNSLELIVILFAFFRMRVIAFPVNHRFPDSKVLDIAKRTGIDIFLFSEGKEITEFGENNLNIEDFFLVEESGQAENLPDLNFTQDATIILTSGSSGKEKAVLHTIGNHIYSALGSNENIRLEKGDRWLLSLPLFHVGGIAILFRVFLSGSSLFLPEYSFDLGKTIFNFGITHISVVEAQLYDLLNYIHKRGGSSAWKLKVVLAGGGPIDKKILLDAIGIGIPIYSTYGMTEMSSQITTSSEPLKKINVEHSGKLLKYRQLNIGKNGEIAVRGKVLFRGYVKNGIVDESAGEKWFFTGDLGYLDKRKFLFITGRSDNMFISGGENIYPEEIEKEMLKMENVIDATVIPEKDEKFGLRPVAFIKVRVGSVPKKKDIVKFMQKSIPSFKIPDRFFLSGDIKSSLLKKDRNLFHKILKEKKSLIEIS